MGCLNSKGTFGHWFGNIHLSGPCNRSCFFCIGQHMQSLEQLDVLKTYPLPGYAAFVAECKAKGVRTVNLTGSNTDPLLYRHLPTLVGDLRRDGFEVGVRTNAATHRAALALFDKVSVSIHSFDLAIYPAIMGSGSPPNLAEIVLLSKDLKLNVVLCPQNAETGDLWNTLDLAMLYGVRRINLREPYGQPHIGDPFVAKGFQPDGHHHGMPFYKVGPMEVTYWDVHYVEVESVNLYANGRVSTDYPVTRGFDPFEGGVMDQSHFPEAKRHLPQWPSRKQPVAAEASKAKSKPPPAAPEPDYRTAVCTTGCGRPLEAETANEGGSR